MQGAKNTLGYPHGLKVPPLMHPSEGTVAEDWLYAPSWIKGAFGAQGSAGEMSQCPLPLNMSLYLTQELNGKVRLMMYIYWLTSVSPCR